MWNEHFLDFDILIIIEDRTAVAGSFYARGIIICCCFIDAKVRFLLLKNKNVARMFQTDTGLEKNEEKKQTFYY